jgi:hypothetical protein
MSKVRTKKLRRLGFKSKKDIRLARNYILQFTKCNKAYAYNNIACNKGLLEKFWFYSQTNVNI